MFDIFPDVDYLNRNPIAVEVKVTVVPMLPIIL